ncbi:MAG TPA: hypothetical protein PL096_07980 [Micropepsaceae bacterium]|nr:hypothetical protein [Micropepsaceae bacterium]
MTNAIKERASLAQMLLWFLALLAALFMVEPEFMFQGEFFSYDIPLSLLLPFVAAMAAHVLGGRAVIPFGLLLPFSAVWLFLYFRGDSFGDPSLGLHAGFASFLLAAAAMALVIPFRPRLSSKAAFFLLLAVFLLSPLTAYTPLDFRETISGMPRIEFHCSLFLMPAAMGFWLSATRVVKLRLPVLLFGALTILALLLLDKFTSYPLDAVIIDLGPRFDISLEISRLAPAAFGGLIGSMTGYAFALLIESVHREEKRMTVALCLILAGVFSSVGLVGLSVLDAHVFSPTLTEALVTAITGETEFADTIFAAPHAANVRRTVAVSHVEIDISLSAFMAVTFGAGLITQRRLRLAAVFLAVLSFAISYPAIMGGEYGLREMERLDLSAMYAERMIHFPLFVEILVLALILFLAARRVSRRLTPPQAAP